VLVKVVVTGAGKGIGRALVEKFATEGHEVAFCCRTKADIEDIEKHIQARHAKKVHGFACDVSDITQLQSFYRFCMDSMGRIDILINNAGIFIPGQVSNEEEGVMEMIMQTNLHSAYHFTRMVLPQMMERKSGHIINMCSTASITAYTNGGSYSISKYALYGMTRVLREEMKSHNVKVTAVLPGATLTNSWAGSDLPEERFMKASDVADTIYAATQLSPSAVIEEILMRPMEGDI
jgi:short-subunit dehydrogenase